MREIVQGERVREIEPERKCERESEENIERKRGKYREKEREYDAKIEKAATPYDENDKKCDDENRLPDLNAFIHLRFLNNTRECNITNQPLQYPTRI
eukprot:251069-Amorphochlora_amoeboformis.AAC.1